MDFPDKPGAFGGGAPGTNTRAEINLYDREVEGKLPLDLDGTWFRVGPDPQYPKPRQLCWRHHVRWRASMSRLSVSRTASVDYKTRYAKTQRC